MGDVFVHFCISLIYSALLSTYTGNGLLTRTSPCLDIPPLHLHYDDDEIKIILKKTNPQTARSTKNICLFILCRSDSDHPWTFVYVFSCVYVRTQHVNILTLISGLLFIFGSAPLWENQTALSRWAPIGPAREVRQIAIPAVMNVFVSIFCLISFVMLLWQMLQLPETFSALWWSLPSSSFWNMSMINI